MLNELYDAASSLAEVGISPKDWHKEYTPIPKPQPLKRSTGRPTFFVFISSDSEITRVERVVEPKETDGLRKWETGNGYSFPYFNIPPLWWISFDPKPHSDDKNFKQALDKGGLTRERLDQFLRNKTDNAKKWEEKHADRVNDCLSKIPGQLRTILGEIPEEYSAFSALIDRVNQIPVEKFYGELQEVFKNQMLADPSAAYTYFGGAFYYGKKEPTNIVSVLLELADASAFQYPVKNVKIRNWINEKLMAHHETTTVVVGLPDAFGNDRGGFDETYPDVTIKESPLGNVKLRAMNHESPCQHRYGTIDEQSCPVGNESRRAMKRALEWLTDPMRKGKTWARATANKEVLLAYPSVLPEDPPNAAMMFGGGVSTENDTDDTSRFEDCAKNVTGTLHGLMAKNPNLDIRVFVLRKMDTARTRVSSNRRYSAQHLIKSAEHWQAGSRNLPQIPIKQFTKDGELVWRDTQTPFPMEVVWTLNTLWSRGLKGTEQKKGQSQWAPTALKEIRAEDGISLLVEEGAYLQQTIPRVLRAATRNSAGLVLALGQAHAQGQVFACSKNYARQPMILPSILGLLLSRLNIAKEDYMRSSPYLVGRLLSLADQLHFHYCRFVRNKPDTPSNKQSFPPQFMGNALMATALEEPVKALALYSNRILPYQAWAKSFHGSDEDNKRVRGILKRLGETCAEASLGNMPERCTDVDKAQMLIGYLARPEITDSGNTLKGDQA